MCLPKRTLAALPPPVSLSLLPDVPPISPAAAVASQPSSARAHSDFWPNSLVTSPIIITHHHLCPRPPHHHAPAWPVTTTQSTVCRLLQGGALLNIRDAFQLSDWSAEVIVGAAKFGAFFGTFLVRARCRLPRLLLPCLPLPSLLRMPWLLLLCLLLLLLHMLLQQRLCQAVRTRAILSNPACFAAACGGIRQRPHTQFLHAGLSKTFPVPVVPFPLSRIATNRPHYSPTSPGACCLQRGHPHLKAPASHTFQPPPVSREPTHPPTRCCLQGGALMLHYGRRKAIAIDSVFFVVGPLVMAASAGVT